LPGRAWALALLACAALAATAAATTVGAAEWGLNELMRALSEVKTVKARFVERKYVAVLTAPLESSGTLEYAAPGRLTKNILKPASESLTLENDQLTIDGGKGSQRRVLNLRDYPALWALVDCVRSTLAGDLAALNRFYQVTLEGGANQWRLVLKPSAPSIQMYLNEVRISGSADWISVIEILQADGDRSLMQVFKEGS
jgi:hypothetical protein